MRLSVVKIFLSAFILALSVVTSASYACDFSDDIVLETESGLFEFEDFAELGSSSYVAHTDTTVFFHLPEEICNEEEDGSWGTDAPEGFFSSQDQPDDQPTSPNYTWEAPSADFRLVFEMTSPRMPAVHPGATYPPPQRG